MAVAKRNWKHVTRNKKQYGKRNTAKYDTPFMRLDETIFKETETETKEVM